MNIAVLEGINIEQDKNNIFKDLNDKIFVYTGKGYLCDYIDRLDLGDNALYKLKMCQEVENMNIQFECAEKEVNDKFDKLSDLLIILDPNIESKVIVMGDADGDEEKIAKVRKKLSSIVQQFVYLNLPLDKIQVMTEREYKNYDKIKRFTLPFSLWNLPLYTWQFRDNACCDTAIVWIALKFSRKHDNLCLK